MGPSVILLIFVLGLCVGAIVGTLFGWLAFSGVCLVEHEPPDLGDWRPDRPSRIKRGRHTGKANT